MRKFTINIIALNILFVMGATVISTLFFLAAIRDESERLAKVEQEQGIQTFWRLLRAKGTDFRIVDGRLMAGDYVLNGNFELPDTIQSIFGGTATVFMGDTRVATNIRREDGSRAVGTKLSGPAHDAIFKHNQPYRGETLILGIPYFTAYDPIRNSRGETIGVLYVGAKKYEFFSRYERYKINVIAGAAVISAIFAVLAVVLLRERKRHVEELQENETKYRTLFENSAEGILILDNGIFDCNEQLCRLFGRNRADILGKSPVDFSPERQPDGTPSDQMARKLIDGALAGEASLFPWRHLRPDGTPVDTEVSLKALTIRGRTVLQAVVRDVTDRKRAEESLRMIRLQQQAMLDNIPDLVWLKDAESRFIAVNAAFAKACGTTPAGLTGKNDLDIWPADLATLYREDDVRVMASGKQIRTEEPLVNVQGKRIWIESIKMPVYDDMGSIIGTTGIARDISKRRETELKLRENEARLAKAQRIAHVGNWDWDILNNSIEFSDEFLRILRISSDQLDTTYEAYLGVIHPDDRHTVTEAVNASLRHQTPYGITYRIICPEGEIRHLRAEGEVEFTPEGTPKRMQGVVKDITESTLAEKALRESEARFREIFEQNEDAIILMGRESLDIIDANRAAEALIGRDKESLAWLGPWSFIVPGDYNPFIGSIPPTGDATPFHLDRIGVVRSDGTRLIASIWGKIIRLRDTEVVYCSIRDITRRIRMEEEARITQSRLIHTNKMTSLGVLVSGIAHEINNPNTFIQGNATLIESFWRDALPILDHHRAANGDFDLGGLPYGEVEQIIPRLVHGVKEGSRRISTIVNNLKDFAREDTTKTFMPINVNKIVEEAKLILSYQIHRYTDQFRLELAEDLPLALGKPQQIEQVVINLIMNALQALPDKGAGVTIATLADRDSPAIIVSVRDEGEGMPREILERITEPFYSTKLERGGTGLGLSISAAIIREHNGTLAFESTPGRGTAATVTLPIAYAAAGDRRND